jgi:alkylation response protein AidB-like acyl-CoA dehydrogenase
VLLEESFKYAQKRTTFGKKLIEHPVIRWKLAEMARQVESTHSWLETMTHQLNTMPAGLAMTELGGPMAQMKAHSSKVFEYCAREACQVFGGNGYTRSGLGEKVERLYRDVRAYAIPGGSEEILLDLSIRQAMKAKL